MEFWSGKLTMSVMFALGIDTTHEPFSSSVPFASVHDIRVPRVQSGKRNHFWKFIHRTYFTFNNYSRKLRKGSFIAFSERIYYALKYRYSGTIIRTNQHEWRTCVTNTNHKIKENYFTSVLWNLSIFKLSIFRKVSQTNRFEGFVCFNKII